MHDTARRGRGRPRASSKAMLEDAASELFLEQSYARTTIEQITQRAGVSRNTFFNYFESKSDVFWVALDDRIDLLATALDETDASSPLMETIADAIYAVGSGFGPGSVPWALTQYELIGSVNELQSSALNRLIREAARIADFVVHRSRKPVPLLLARSIAYAVIGAAVAGVRAWADAGTTRGELVPFLREALAPIVDGFQRRLDVVADVATTE